jgi:DNA-binding transcriptional regulator GbsR (MarR family)
VIENRHEDLGVSRELPFLKVPVLPKCSASKGFSPGISRKYFQNPEEFSDINRSTFAGNLERNSYLPN